MGLIYCASKRVLQMISERRFHDVLQNYAKVYGDNIFLEGLTEEERMQRREKLAIWP